MAKAKTTCVIGKFAISTKEVEATVLLECARILGLAGQELPIATIVKMCGFMLSAVLLVFGCYIIKSLWRIAVVAVIGILLVFTAKVIFPFLYG